MACNFHHNFLFTKPDIREHEPTAQRRLKLTVGLPVNCNTAAYFQKVIILSEIPRKLGMTSM